NVDHVVGQTATVREATEVAADDAKPVGAGGGSRRHAEVDLQRVSRDRVRRDLRLAGDPGQQRGDDVGPVCLLDPEAEQRVEQTPTTALLASGSETDLPSWVILDSGTWITTAWTL